MSGTLKLSQLGSAQPSATLSLIPVVQTVGTVTADGLVCVPIQGVTPAEVTATAGTTILMAQLLTTEIQRTGPTAAFTDTTDTAANIVAGLPGVIAGYGFDFSIANFTSYDMTIAAGTGVTLALLGAQTAVITPANTVRFRLQVTNTASSAQAVTITRLWSGGI